MNTFVSTATSWVISKEIVPKFLIVPNVKPEDIHQINAPANHSETAIHAKLESPGINGEGTKIFHNFLIVITDVFTVQEIIKPEIVQQHGNGKPQPLTILLVVQVLPHTVTHLPHHITHLTHSHQPAINTVNLLYMCKHQPSTLTLPIFNQTYTKLLPHRLHRITKTLTIIQTNNKCTHHQHNHLTHSFHNHSTPRFHHHISYNTHLLTVHL